MKNVTYIAVIAALTAGLAAPSFADGGRGKGRALNFETMDTNSDGFITVEEIAALKKARFDENDTNKDGFLTQEELKAAVEKRGEERGGKRFKRKREMTQEQSEKRMGRMFRGLDENSDGKIALTELPDRSARMIEKLDTDKDGKISKAEAEAFKGKRKGKRG